MKRFRHIYCVQKIAIFLHYSESNINEKKIILMLSCLLPWSMHKKYQIYFMTRREAMAVWLSETDFVG